MSTKTAAAATPSYHSAWNLAHGRMAEADAKHNAWLDAKLESEKRTRLAEAKRLHQVRISKAKRKRDAAIRMGEDAPRCIICGQRKASKFGRKCQDCHNFRLCRCGKRVSKHGPDCAECRGQP